MTDLTLHHRQPPIRWPELIAAMQEAGISLRDIGDALGVSHSSVQRWQLGSCPNYEDGRALLELFERVRPYVERIVRIA